jgi:alpha,alpha-trehalose phosphorylase
VADEVFAAWVLGPAAHVPKRSTRKGLQAVLFDLDGVLVDTAEFHYRAWKRLAEELGVPFDRQMNHGFRGVGRMDCLEKLLRDHAHCFVVEEMQMLAERKNAYYLEQVKTLVPGDLEAGARGLAMGLRALSGGGARLALVSASRNARLVLKLLRIEDWFDAIIDGGEVTRGKPDPQCFLLAAERLRVRPEACVVVEDADAGLRAARAAGMGCVGVGNGVGACDVHVHAVGELTIEQLEEIAGRPLHAAR